MKNYLSNEELLIKIKERCVIPPIGSDEFLHGYLYGYKDCLDYILNLLEEKEKN